MLVLDTDHVVEYHKGTSRAHSNRRRAGYSMWLKQTKRAVVGCLKAVLPGACLFGVVGALGGAYEAWVETVVLFGKSRGEERTILGHTALCFFGAAILGCLAGAIASIVMAVERFVRSAWASRR
jgi:hypothetical protein